MPKRAITTAAKAPAAKAQRVNPLFVGVVEGIKQAGLEESSAKMLIASIPGAFGLPKDERHAVQQKAVMMLEEVLASAKQALQEKLDSANAKVMELEASKDSLEGKTQEAGELAAKVADEKRFKTIALEEAKDQVLSLLAAQQENKEAQAKAESALSKAQVTKESFSTSIGKHFKPLQEGTLDSTVAEAHKVALLLVLESSLQEDSLKLALPISIVKPMAQRTALDMQVFQEVSRVIDIKDAELAKAATTWSETVETAMADVKATESQIVIAKASEDSAAADASEAEQHEREAAAAALAIKEARDNAGPDFEKSVAERDACAMELENFTLYNIGCLELLRDGAPDKKNKAADIEVAPVDAE